MGQVSFKPPTSVHTTKTVTTRQQSPGGVPGFCGQILSMIGKVVFAKPAHINAIWLSLTVTITCYRSHERLCRLTFVFHISKAQQGMPLSFFLWSAGDLVLCSMLSSGLCWCALTAGWDQSLNAFKCLLKKKKAWRCLERFGGQYRESGPRVCKQFLSQGFIPSLSSSQAPWSWLCVRIGLEHDQLHTKPRHQSCSVAA